MSKSAFNAGFLFEEMFENNPFLYVILAYLLLLPPRNRPWNLFVETEMRLCHRPKMRKPHFQAEMNSCQAIKNQPAKQYPDYC